MKQEKGIGRQGRSGGRRTLQFQIEWSGDASGVREGLGGLKEALPERGKRGARPQGGRVSEIKERQGSQCGLFRVRHGAPGTQGWEGWLGGRGSSRPL